MRFTLHHTFPLKRIMSITIVCPENSGHPAAVHRTIVAVHLTSRLGRRSSADSAFRLRHLPCRSWCCIGELRSLDEARANSLARARKSKARGAWVRIARVRRERTPREL